MSVRWLVMGLAAAVVLTGARVHAAEPIEVDKTYTHIPTLGESKVAVGAVYQCRWGLIAGTRDWGCWYHAVPSDAASFDNSAFEIILSKDVKPDDRGDSTAEVVAIEMNLTQVPRRAALKMGKMFGFTPDQVREVIVHGTRIVNGHRMRLTRGGGALQIREMTYR
ncbi:hypothetical protein SAMN05216241_10267 [Limimonas halophila]|uniref:DUF4920 domain-containing protein n=1 Tax=Limimonas halophila TaxID=1082479 RepID=A0A1G7N8W3_9PROT|nr:hypothetical protein [Limimonas halophila]SDF70381.1 hypothetical protein SAMN05216241_10267 [Limimonas halophila]